jgi:hypothetical protein
MIGVQIEYALDDLNISVSTNESESERLLHVEGGVAGGSPNSATPGLSLALHVPVIGAGDLR